MEIGRTINDRYQLQRPLRQGQVCAVYQGVDQRLVRNVAVKIVPATYVATYKAAARLTSQFSHPNIIGLYDMISEADILYLVQEYVEGDDFITLLNTSFKPHDVADIGCQLCQALLYASLAHPTRRVSHGDLTPTSVLRDHTGLIRINNFALPPDIAYFTRWSAVGGDGSIIADRELPWGQYSDGRETDDTRAVGLLLYQLLTSRPTGVLNIEPPVDARLRFRPGTPPELCELIARTVLSQHPQHITTIEVLHTELQTLTLALESASPVEVPVGYAPEPVAQRQFYPLPSTGKLVTPLTVKEDAPVGALPGPALSNALEHSRPMAALQPGAVPAVPDVSTKLAAARQAAYPQLSQQPQARRPSLTVLILLCLVIFALFFVIGYFGGHMLFPQ